MLKSRSGFTLIELLIVIGILAVLATVTVLVLNPAQLFAQARDSQRLSDVGSVKGAVSLYLTTADNPDIDSGTGFTCGTNFGASVDSASTTFAAATISHGGSRLTNGEGWVAVNMDTMQGGSPLPTLPVDPTNTTTNNRYYGYSCDAVNLTFEINANMESARYNYPGGAPGTNPDDVESSDGGDNHAFYETGTDPKLDL